MQVLEAGKPHCPQTREEGQSPTWGEEESSHFLQVLIAFKAGPARAALLLPGLRRTLLHWLKFRAFLLHGPHL